MKKHNKQNKRNKQQVSTQTPELDPMVNPQQLAGWPKGYEPSWLGAHVFIILLLGMLITVATTVALSLF